MAQYEGDLERAITLFQESLPVFERTGNALSQAIVLLNLGEVMEQRGECERAQTFAERSMQLFAARDDPRGVAICLVLSAVLTERRRDYDRAQALLGQALLTFQEVGGGEYWIDALEASAALAGVQGQAEKGAQLLGAADAIGETMGFSLNCRQRARHERFSARLRAQLGDQAFQRGWHAGRAMTLEQAIAHALNESPGA